MGWIKEFEVEMDTAALRTFLQFLVRTYDMNSDMLMRLIRRLMHDKDYPVCHVECAELSFYLLRGIPNHSRWMNVQHRNSINSDLQYLKISHAKLNEVRLVRLLWVLFCDFGCDICSCTVLPWIICMHWRLIRPALKSCGMDCIHPLKVEVVWCPVCQGCLVVGFWVLVVVPLMKCLWVCHCTLPISMVCTMESTEQPSICWPNGHWRIQRSWKPFMWRKQTSQSSVDDDFTTDLVSCL